MALFTSWGSALSIIALLIAGGVILGAWLPRYLLNERLRPTACSIYCDVSSRWCSDDGITRRCYEVHRNVAPDNATCWPSPQIALFTDAEEAERYAASCGVQTRRCFVDPTDRCAAYLGYADVATPSYVGFAFAVLSGLFLGCVLVHSIYTMYKGRSDYEEVK